MEQEESVNEEDSNRSPDKSSELERYFSDGVETEKGAKTSHPRVRITFYHYRKRLTDHDNLSTKAILDGIVREAILRDDSPKFISEVRQRQIQIKSPEKERVMVLIEEIG